MRGVGRIPERYANEGSEEFAKLLGILPNPKVWLFEQTLAIV